MTVLASAKDPTVGGKSTRLPTLRNDLLLTEGDVSTSGAPTWRIYDPLRHRYIAIDRTTRIALELWQAAETLDLLAAAISQRTGTEVSVEELRDLETFLRQNNLVEPEKDEWRRRWAATKSREESWAARLMHNYLFFRIPLLAPTSLLMRSLPWVEPLFRRSTHLAFVCAGLLALYLVSRQWDAFLAEGRVLLTVPGIAIFGVTVFIVKIFHELGHAYVATRFGCRVPVIGIAVMMGVPLLYTDVTDAWRLKRPKDRMKIDAAGVCVELMLAVLATLLWVFLPDGIPRTVAFLIATTSWFMSVAINLNPFMKFDGYYILCDLIGVENLQPRANELGVWWLRKLLFGLRQPTPEPSLPKALHSAVIGYALAIWLYRLVLFTGIAVVVYHAFFKVLGLALFAFEIAYFIARPLYNELKAWWGLRDEILASQRTKFSVGAVLAVICLAVLPWSRTISAPAYVEAAEIAKIYAKKPGRISELAVVDGQQVKAGDLLIRIVAPDIEHEMRVTKARLRAVEVRVARLASNDQDRSEFPVLQSTQAALAERIAGLEREMQDLELRAPIDGIIRDWDRNLQVGKWVGAREHFGIVVAPKAVLAVSFVREADVERLQVGAKSTFIADAAGASPLETRIARIATANTQSLHASELTQQNGGPIEVTTDARSKAPQPIATLYRVDLDVAAALTVPSMRLRGQMHMVAKPESLIAAAFRRIMQVIIRESAA